MFNILLQRLDNGRLTDRHGKTADFTNTIVAMTSNIGSPYIQKIAENGGDEEEMRQGVLEALRAQFLLEFLNRIDHRDGEYHFHRLAPGEAGRTVVVTEAVS